ncbi:MAG TPA: hypothetical protein VHK02_08400 [Actinomycetota bacterium]|jgi:hypothetical protein|nr:hypothetical protein [Actinomycetota bacterium]
MSQLTVSTATRPPAFRERAASDHTDPAPAPRPSRLWAVVEALAYAGAVIDPSGVLAVQRIRQAQEEEEHRAR